MSVHEAEAKGGDEMPEPESRTLVEEVCDTLHHTDWDTLGMRALFRGINSVERARLFARAEALRQERHGEEPRKQVVAKANEIAEEPGGDA